LKELTLTAQVAILNKNGVALASDKMMTTQDTVHPVPPDKYAQKIFRLSERQPLSIMFYNNANVTSVHLANVILPAFKEATKQFSNQSIDDWCNAFLESVQNFDSYPENAVDRNMDRYLCSIADDLNEEMQNWHPFVGGRYNEALALLIDIKFAGLIERGLPNRAAVSKFVSNNRDAFEAAAQRILVNPERAGLRLRLEDLLIQLFKNVSPSQSYAGIVIAGYGKGDSYPRLRAFELEGQMGQMLFYRHTKSIDISDDKAVAIDSFAQHDRIDSLLQGVPERSLQDIEDILSKEILTQNNRVLDLPGVTITGDFDKTISKAISIGFKTGQRIFTRLRSHFNDNSKEQFNALAEVMYPPTLKEFSRMLVSLEIKAQEFVATPSVGGQIDTAIMARNMKRARIKAA
jgi:hypothetical protein